MLYFVTKPAVKATATLSILHHNTLIRKKQGAQRGMRQRSHWVCSIENRDKVRGVNPRSVWDIVNAPLLSDGSAA